MINYRNFTYKLPVNTKVSFGEGEVIQEEIKLITLTLPNIHFYDNANFDNCTECYIIDIKKDETLSQFCTRLALKNIKVITGQTWTAEDNKYYDKGDATLVLQQDGDYIKTYPNKTQKVNYLDLKKADKLNEINNNYNLKIEEGYNFGEIDNINHIDKYIIKEDKVVITSGEYNITDLPAFETYKNNLDAQKKTYIDDTNACISEEQLDLINPIF